MPDSLNLATSPRQVVRVHEPSARDASLERMQRLVPALTSSDLYTCALAYTAHYQDNVLQLEHEWELLTNAVFDAWQDEQYEVVVRLTTALAQSAARQPDQAAARRLLQLGIASSRKLRQQEKLAAFLSRLGGLLFIQGKTEQGWRIWQTALHFTDSLAGVWEPLVSFVHIADLLGNFTACQQFVTTIQSKKGDDQASSLAVALFVRGLYARWEDHAEQARRDFHACLDLLLAHQRPNWPAQQLFLLVVQTELARLQREYEQAQIYAETAITLAQTFADHYTFATLLIDQGSYAAFHRQLDDVRCAYRRLCAIEPRFLAPNATHCIRFFEQFLTTHGAAHQETQHPPLISPFQRLSEREIDVLTLVATGYSNQEIAARLVVTTGTVKKHLEHIYTRLDVHNRTSALVKARELGLLA